MSRDMKEMIIEAFGSGYKSSSVLLEVIEEVSRLACKEDHGRDSDPIFCGECIVCICREIIEGRLN